MYLLFAMLAGAAVPVQTAVNTRLRQSVGSPIGASLISMAVAALVATVLAVAATGSLVPDLSVPAHEPWWIWLGGFMGVCFIAGNVVLFPQIGAVQTVILPILGQVLMGLAIDRFGLFAAPVVDVSAWRLAGALVVLLGIAMVLEIPRVRVSHGSATGAKLWAAKLWALRGCGVLIGAGSAIQTAVNGHLGRALGSPVQASQISLGVGAILLLALAFGLPGSRRALASGIERGPWWMWLGGVLGAFFVFGGAAISPILGTGTTVIAMLVGNIACGQAMESLGIGTGGHRTPPTPYRLAGLVTVLVGVAMVRLL